MIYQPTRLLTLAAVASLTLAATGAMAQGMTASATTTAATTTVSSTAKTTGMMPTRSQSRFLTNAIQGNLAEIDASKLALQQSQNSDVKAYAQQMIDEHSATNTKAVALAESLRIGAPTTPSLAQQAKAKALGALSGDAFDKMYVKMMVSDHKSTVKMFQKEAGLSADGAVATFAKETLPALQKHLDEVRKLEAKVNGK